MNASSWLPGQRRITLLHKMLGIGMRIGYRADSDWDLISIDIVTEWYVWAGYVPDAGCETEKHSSDSDSDRRMTGCWLSFWELVSFGCICDTRGLRRKETFQFENSCFLLPRGCPSLKSSNDVYAFVRYMKIRIVGSMNRNFWTV